MSNASQPPIRAVPMVVFPTLESLQDVHDLADSKLPITTKNEISSLLNIMQNTLLKVIEDEQ